MQERSRAVNRLQGVLERANIKLAAVATDVMGVSGRAILAALSHGRTDPATMAELANGRMRTQLPLPEQASTGLMRDHHRRLLAMQLAHIAFLDEPIDAHSVAIMRSLTELELGALSTPPGVSVDGAGEAGCAVDPEEPSSPLSFVQAVSVLDPISGRPSISAWPPAGGENGRSWPSPTPSS